MKKIMFNDRFGLTQAVLEGIKTQTRRFVPNAVFTLQWDVREMPDGLVLCVENTYGDFVDIRDTKFSKYKLGDVVAVAQSYYDAKVVGDTTVDYPLIFDDCDAGYNNKMFVKSKLMPHQIRITNVRLQQLQDITDEECLQEGIEKELRTDGEYNYTFFDAKRELYIRERTPRDAYARLIDAISGMGTWWSNPWVVAYSFELVD